MEELSVSKKTYRYLVLPGNEHSLVLEALERRCWWEPIPSSAGAGAVHLCDFWWGGNGQRFPFDVVKRSKTKKRIFVCNKLENHREICTKTGLASTVQACCQQLKKRTISWAPETYAFSRDKSQGPELGRLKRAFQHHQHKAQEAGAGGHSGKLWILKPSAMNRGKGIQIFHDFKAMETFLRARALRESFIVQKYIENPLLIEKRKFDLRMYVLVISEPRKVFLYPEGYVRTCSMQYKSDDISDQRIHLTNDAVQKDAKEYGAFEDCNKLSFEQFEKALQSKLDFKRDVYPQIKQCVSELFSAASKRMLNPKENLPGTFELMGLDFMLDDESHVQLIEVNTSPALFRKGAHLKELLPQVMEEVLQKALDPWFPPPQHASYPDKLNVFEEIPIGL